MPTQLPGGMVRLDIDNPEDLQVLIDSGLIWRSSQKDLDKVFEAIKADEVTRAPDKEPPEVREFLDKVMAVPSPYLNPLADEQPLAGPVEPVLEEGAGPPIA